jgi:hypothetical protein
MIPFEFRPILVRVLLPWCSAGQSGPVFCYCTKWDLATVSECAMDALATQARATAGLGWGKHETRDNA